MDVKRWERNSDGVVNEQVGLGGWVAMIDITPKVRIRISEWNGRSCEWNIVG